MSALSGKIYVAGHRGMVGSAVCRRLATESCEVVTASRDQLDLTRPARVEEFFRDEKPDAVVFAAARVGGVLANDTYPVDFLSDNLLMSTAAINGAFAAGVKRFLFLGSTCIYPRDCPQPIREDSLLTGPLEKTNEAYALAKICGLKLCQYYRRQFGVMFHSAMPTNLYGPGDNYHPEHSHVLPALIRRFHEAKQQGFSEVRIWGTGTPRREFLYVDDLADAIAFLLKQDQPPDWVNVGTGVDLPILALASLVAETVGYTGRIVTDPSRPDGTPIKCTDMSLLHSLGWNHRVPLADGLRMTYEHFLSEQRSGQLRSV
ncbi:GDP-L-fucose synthase family protein [Novipirellula artificiosorum]|uniref:GDP-L-fucose synthase n=1 Tax=Novipirellula artificiosorum TaxID=2528016 RepID=A0A5C6DQB2_9BACT|nr:GDP-L-fucose synthase [Novipirellula artificiosorum]TWU37206.1 GDP-L-fucose synthase [Novipirellula artificiosorum]